MKYSPALITFLFFISAPLFSEDRLAADEVAAKYRTTLADPKPTSVPAEIQSAVFKNPEAGLPGLVAFLVSGTDDDFVKVKRIHDWITENIAYDSDLLLGLSDQGSRKVNDLVSLRRTTCGGFAGVFQRMAELAGLKSETVTGNSKTCWIKSSKRDCHHVWNAVNLRGKWYYVDTTADSRFTYKNSAFTPKKRYADTFLFIRTEAKLLINLPLEERQQFMSPPMTREAYFKIPRVTVAYYKYAIDYTPETIALFHSEKRDFEGGALEKVFDAANAKNEVFELRLKAPENISFFPQIVANEDESFDDSADSDKQVEESDPLPNHAFCFREGGFVVCQYSAAKPGKYKAYLQAREAGDGHKFSLVHAFTLHVEKAGPVFPRKTRQIYTNALFNFQKFRILSTDFSTGTSFPSTEVERPEEHFLTSFVFDENGKQIPSAVDYSFLSKTRIKFYYKFPAPGNYWLKLQTRIPNKTGAQRQNVSVTRLEIADQTNRVFPPLNEWIFTKAFAEENLLFVKGSVGSGDVTAVIAGGGDKNLECVLYDKNSKTIPGGRISSEGANKICQFSIPAAGRFGGRILLKEGSDSKILGYFRTER
ncbi:MAG: hypothetical protein JNM63_17965 [Spirochaetia bacterium]|nr:hypothetical protein [Spirochaetia bacterium]